MFISPHIPDKYYSSWAQYSIVLPKGSNRVSIIEKLKDNGIPSMVYYKIPVHLQTGYAEYFDENYILTVSEETSEKILSLPMHPYLTENNLDKVLNILEMVT